MESCLKCIYPALPKTERARSTVLGGSDPDGKNKNKFLYCFGKNVFIRDINKPDVCELFSTHSYNVTVAKYNQTGHYIASGDASGTVLVWSPESEPCKAQGKPDNTMERAIGGAIRDICWGPDKAKNDMKLAFCGEGSSMVARIVDAFTSNNKGDLGGHTKAVNSIAFRPKRPYNIVTACEDSQMNFAKSFKYSHTVKDHQNFVNCVKFSPDGEIFVSGDQNGKIYIYDGVKGEKIGAFVDENVKAAPTKIQDQGPVQNDFAHKGGIFGVDFSDDGTELLSVSGDKSAKIWNVANRQLVAEFNFADEIHNQQLGCLWQGENIMTVSLSGYINFLDRSKPTNGTGVHTPLKILRGYNKPITSMAAALHQHKLFTGGSDALILAWDLHTGLAEEIEGKGHSNQIMDMKVAGDTLITISMDDTIRYTSIVGDTYIYDKEPLKLPSQPRGVAAQEGPISVVACFKHIVVVDSNLSIQFLQPVPYETVCVDIEGRTVAVGTSVCKVFIFELDASSNSLKEVTSIDVGDDITDVKFSPDGSRLAVGTGPKKLVQLYVRESEFNFKLAYSEVKHTARVFTLAWSPNSEYFASGSVDGCVTIWSRDKVGITNNLHFIKAAHYKGEVKKVVWVAEDVLATCSGDGIIKQFNVYKK